MSVFIPTPKKHSVQECSNYHTITLISHSITVMLKVLQARLHQYMNLELSDAQTGFRKSRGTRDPYANNLGSLKKQEDSRKKKKQQQPKNKNKQTNKKNTYFCFIDYVKALDCVYHYKLWKILEEMEIEEHLSCLWRNN